MIKTTFTAKGQLLGDLAAYVESFQQSVNATVAEVVAEVQPSLLDELGYAPPERDRSAPLDWSSEKQRKAFFASGAFGAGIPFARTGALPDGWIVDTSGGRVVISNPVPGSLYLYGSLAKSNPGAWQQGYLAAIGWVPAYKTVFFWVAAITDEVVKRIDEQFKGIGSVTTSTRAYTRH